MGPAVLQRQRQTGLGFIDEQVEMVERPGGAAEIHLAAFGDDGQPVEHAVLDIDARSNFR